MEPTIDPIIQDSCLSEFQKSLSWCQGTPEYSGIKRRIYYIAKTGIATFPVLSTDNIGRVTSAIYEGSFVLRADRVWHHIDVLPDKCQVTSEPQGEIPSQTQLNKLEAVHPSVGEEASAAAAYLNNTDNVFIVEDIRGRFRVIGSDRWETKTSVKQDLGQGATGTVSTTISAEASDVVPAPFYQGDIIVEDGVYKYENGAYVFYPSNTETTSTNTETTDGQSGN